MHGTQLDGLWVRLKTGKVRVPLPAGKPLDVGRVAVGEDERIGQ